MSDERHISALGDKLLQGWTMLKECCENENCVVPLMEKDDIVCVSCESVFARDEEDNIVLKNRGTKKEWGTSKPAQEPVEERTESKETEQPTQYNIDSFRDPEPPSTSPVVEELGQLLLSGWTMLGEHCDKPGCNVPLMEKKNLKKIVCISCRTNFERNDDNQLVILPKQSAPSQPQPSTNETQSTSHTTARMKLYEQASNKPPTSSSMSNRAPPRPPTHASPFMRPLSQFADKSSIPSPSTATFTQQDVDTFTFAHGTLRMQMNKACLELNSPSNTLDDRSLFLVKYIEQCSQSLAVLHQSTQTFLQN